MSIVFPRVGALVFWVASLPVFATDVQLGTNVSDFEQFYNRGGGSVEHIRCIFDHLGYTPDIQRMPWRRARQEVSTGKIDGFFTAIQTPEVERYATLSAPLLLENWYWYWPAGTEAPDHWRNGVRLGAILGSHQAVWLDQQGYPVHMRISNLPQLIKLLLSGRIDAFIADRDHMRAAVDALGIAENQYQERFLRYMPLGVYFGNEFLASRPEFLRAFNRHIIECTESGFVMSASEQADLHHWLAPMLRDWQRAPGLVTALKAQNRRHADLDEETQEQLDREWQLAFREGDYRKVQPWLDQALSDRLRALAVDADGRITEVILTDQRGLNVAISDMTSDYWQGDEAKFQRALALDAGQLNFEPVVYDESTRRFQVHVSQPVMDPDTGERLGVLIVGVDIDKAMSRAH